MSLKSSSLKSLPLKGVVAALALLAGLATASAASAQSWIRVGQTVNGTLTASDPVMAVDQCLTVWQDQFVTRKTALFAKSAHPVGCIDRNPIEPEIGKPGILGGIGMGLQIALFHPVKVSGSCYRHGAPEDG